MKVGSAEHPMLEAHYIMWIVLETSQGYQKKDLRPGEKPVARFALAEGETVLAAYEYCKALYEHSQEREIRDFVNTFVGVYINMAKRREERESHYDCYDHTQMLNFDRADESDLDYREQVGRRVDRLLRKYIGHPQPGERNHKRACEILKLYLEGYSFRKIAKIVNLDVSVVYRYLKRAVKKIEEQQDLTTI